MIDSQLASARILAVLSECLTISPQNVYDRG